MTTDARDIIVIGSSAGGIEALNRLLGHLPPELDASLFVVQHLSPDSPGFLADILGRSLVQGSRLRVTTAVDGEPIELGRIVVAPPDRHLLVERGRTRVVRGPRENLHRPSVDTLFRSAAMAYGRRVAGVVLSGALDDGTAGLQAIKRRGGLAIVQEPDESQFPSMPASAIAHVDVDHRLPASGIGALLGRLAGDADEDRSEVSEALRVESGMATGETATVENIGQLGELSPFTCPECHGSLWELKDGELIRYRCHVGHAFSSESLQAGQFYAQERALWIALRALEEQGFLFRRLARRAMEQGNRALQTRFEHRAMDRELEAEAISAMLKRDGREVSDIAP